MRFTLRPKLAVYPTRAACYSVSMRRISSAYSLRIKFGRVFREDLNLWRPSTTQVLGDLRDSERSFVIL